MKGGESMGRKAKVVTEPKNIGRRDPGSTIESRENQLIALAVDLAEQQLRDGTASSQVITHYLKLGSTKMQLEKEKLKKENELLIAKTEQLESLKRLDGLYERAIEAMKEYTGGGGDSDV